MQVLPHSIEPHPGTWGALNNRIATLWLTYGRLLGRLVEALNVLSARGRLAKEPNNNELQLLPKLAN